MSTKEQVCVVIGASHAGINLAFNLRKEGWEGEIILFDSDSEFPYHRPPLSKAYLTAEEGTAHSLLFPKENYELDHIQLQLGQRVAAINSKNKEIVLEDGSTQAYNKLVLATGARAFIPPIKGIDEATNLFTMRTAEDAFQIREALKASTKKRVVIIGGGYIGLETAASLNKLGAEVVVLEREERVLSRVTAPVMSEFFMQLHKDHGVTILTNKNVVSIETDQNTNHIHCDDDSTFDADIIVVGVGIKVNTELAKTANVELENGIKVDETTRTSNEDIYAIGDCTYHYNQHYKRNVRLESVQNAVDQAKVAAKAICGQEVAYNAIPWFWSDQYDIKLQLVGLSTGYNDVVVRKEDGENNSFSVWYFKDDELLAVDAVANARAYMMGTRAIKAGQLLDKAKCVDPKIPIKPTSFLVD